ncbi:MAG: hypothetical protein M3M86_00635 [Thermoproteota archaeon]|nr:hypothetical protein [Thermoproteota archaeon]
MSIEYCFTYPTGGYIPRICEDTPQECEDVRNQIIQQGFQPTDCSEQTSKVKKSKTPPGGGD